MENRLRSQRTQTPNKINVNSCKLIDFVIRIEWTRVILRPPLSNFLRNLSSIFACSYIWKHVSWQSRFRCYAVYQLYQRYMFQFIPIYIISEGRRNCSTLWPAQQHVTKQETCYQTYFDNHQHVTKHKNRKHVTKYKNMRKWMVEFFRNF